MTKREKDIRRRVAEIENLVDDEDIAGEFRDLQFVISVIDDQREAIRLCRMVIDREVDYTEGLFDALCIGSAWNEAWRAILKTEEES